MAKAYWVSIYRSVSNPDAFKQYAELAGPAILKNGGRFLARGNAARAYEGGVENRCVLVEFESLERAIAARESPEYGEALRALGSAAERDFRIVEGVA